MAAGNNVYTIEQRKTLIVDLGENTIYKFTGAGKTVTLTVEDIIKSLAEGK